MKRIISAVLIVVMLLIAGVAFADSIGSIIPNGSMWGISQDDFSAISEADCTRFYLGKTPGLLVSGVEIDSYAMDCYYLFGAPMQTSSGESYWGLSKVTCLWSGTEKRTSDELRQCYGILVDDMKAEIGEPVSVDKAKTTWKDKEYIVEIGTGRFAKYTGSENYTIAIIITWANIPKPTPQPSPTPKPTKVPKPEYGEMDYKGVSRNPEKYEGKLVKFTGIVVQATETVGSGEDDGVYWYDDIYVLRVATKYKKYKSIDGYDTDDIVYVVVRKNKVEGGRILEDDKINVYGKYDGIETYEAIFGNSVSIPRIEASRVVIK